MDGWSLHVCYCCCRMSFMHLMVSELTAEPVLSLRLGWEEKGCGCMV